jgi:hypothetical protein
MFKAPISSRVRRRKEELKKGGTFGYDWVKNLAMSIDHEMLPFEVYSRIVAEFWRSATGFFLGK